MKVSDGVLVLLITACFYTFGYSFYLGYYQEKGIPNEFINIDVAIMLKFGFFSCLAFSMVSMLIDFSVRKEDEKTILYEKAKRFITKNLIFIITIFIFSINAVMRGDWFLIIPTCMILWAYLRQDIDVSFGDKGTDWRKWIPSFKLKEISSTGTSILAGKLKVHWYYYYFSWFLALAFLLYNIGGLASHTTPVTLVCNKDFDVLEVYADAVLVTKDYKSFKFMDKSDCEFSIPPKEKSR